MAKPIGIVLAAGRGTRMGRLTDTTPKPLLLVRGKPILVHILEGLALETAHLVIVIGYLGDRIKETIGSSFSGVPITYVTQENPQGGTLDALRKGLETAGSLEPSGYITVYADDIHLPEAYEHLGMHAAERPNELMLVGTSVSDKEQAKRFGVFELGPGGDIVRIVEKPADPPSSIINCGLYYLPRGFWDLAFADFVPQQNGELYLTDPLSVWIARFGAALYVSPSWEPIGTPEDLQRANRIV
jgi:UDP-N-acetylglucosamine diphosphorylase / glucose-1-phosphate thymidylyltransferase / UDP-N-acetylgalactosamine diphosphorylase / glucosamine-1-phosphate N-acetyltransferase / galactosamine-1-phosphate N-acetyltransferase